MDRIYSVISIDFYLADATFENVNLKKHNDRLELYIKRERLESWINGLCPNLKKTNKLSIQFKLIEPEAIFFQLKFIEILVDWD